MWIENSVDLISWLHQKPADLDLHCFQKLKKSFEHGVLIRSNMVTLLKLDQPECLFSLICLHSMLNIK